MTYYQLLQLAHEQRRDEGHISLRLRRHLDSVAQSSQWEADLKKLEENTRD